MWSFGWILYELYTGYPLFAGEDETEQMQMIMEVKGIPPLTVIKQGNRWRTFFHSNYNPKLIPNSRNKTRIPDTKKLQDMITTDDPYFVDFIDKWIEWRVEDRLNPRRALQHNWIKAGLSEISKGKAKGTKSVQKSN